MPGGPEKIVRLWFATRDQCLGWHYAKYDHLSTYSKIPKFSLLTMIATIQLFEKISTYPSRAAGPKPLII